jgi:hypothetical protein
MKKTVAVALVGLGISFVGGGAYAVDRGLDAKAEVRAELSAQNIRTPADAAIPNTLVRDVATATAMADIVDHHARKTTKGLSFAEMGRFLARSGDPAGTSVEADAVRGPDGQPVRNPLRTVAFESSAVRTGLFTTVMAFNVADLVVGLGAMTLALGVALAAVGVVIGDVRVRVPVRRTAVVPLPAAAG